MSRCLSLGICRRPRFASISTRHASRFTGLALLICLVACGGCTREKSTAELIGDMKSQQGADKLKAARLLPWHEEDTATVIPALIEALKDKDGHVRRSAAIGLGELGEQAKDAIPALQSLQKDHDARIREAASVALSRIDPTKFSTNKIKSGKGK